MRAGNRVPRFHVGLRENLAQCSLLVVVNAFVGAMVGMERSILPRIAEDEFRLKARTAVLSVLQLGTGALSDWTGRKPLIVGGMWIQAIGIGIVVIASGFTGFAAGLFFLGLGTAMVYPTLLSAVGDVVHPSWRASSVGVYRLWRDLGYAAGAFIAGVIADAFGLPAAMSAVAVVTFLSGVAAALRMTETLHALERSI